jgi:protein TonB
MRLKPAQSSFFLSLTLHGVLVVALFVFSQVSQTWFAQNQSRTVAPSKTIEITFESDSQQIVQTEKVKPEEKKSEITKPEKVFLSDVTQNVKESQSTQTPVQQQLQRQQSGTTALQQLGVALALDSAEAATSENAVLNNQDLSHASDYVVGIKKSDRTLLNTREYVFFSYFNRIKQKLDTAWDSSLREQLNHLYSQGRSLASESEMTTKTIVTLNDKGEITRVQVLEESGIIDLDDAAVKAFNEAGPFPNPPRGLVDKNGKISLRWDFTLKT